MTEFTVEFAGVPVAVQAQFAATRQFCRDYLTQREPELRISVTQEDLLAERESVQQLETFQNPSMRFLETLVLHRKLAEQLVHRGILLMHGSAVSADGLAYIFTARSGVGKSTHARHWSEELPKLGCEVFSVNDDKPFIQLTDAGAFVCGTPWNGKHHLSRNCSVPLRAICFLRRGETNAVTPVTQAESWEKLFNQIYFPTNASGTGAVLQLIDRLLQCTRQYDLVCTDSPEAALTAWQALRPDAQTAGQETGHEL